MKREDSLGYVINHVARVFARALHEAIAPMGVVPGQFAQLLALYERDGVTQQELCDIVEIEQPTMANTLNRMERDGLIERRPHPTDGRKQLIFLTGRARQLEGQLVEAAIDVNRRAKRDLSEEEHQDLLAVLRQLGSNLTTDQSI